MNLFFPWALAVTLTSRPTCHIAALPAEISLKSCSFSCPFQCSPPHSSAIFFSLQQKSAIIAASSSSLLPTKKENNIYGKDFIVLSYIQNENKYDVQWLGGAWNDKCALQIRKTWKKYLVNGFHEHNQEAELKHKQFYILRTDGDQFHFRR